jgi:hypothetical protein
MWKRWKCARGPVCVAGNAVPRLEGQAMDAGDLVVRLEPVLIEALEVLEAQDVQVELVRIVALQVAKLSTERNCSCCYRWRLVDAKTGDGRILSVSHDDSELG